MYFNKKNSLSILVVTSSCIVDNVCSQLSSPSNKVLYFTSSKGQPRKKIVAPSLQTL